MAKKIVTPIGPAAWLKNDRWIWLFGGAFLALGMFLPWFDVGLGSVNGIDIAFSFGKQPDVVRNGMHSMMTGALPLAASLFFLLIAVIGFARPAFIERHPHGVWWALTLMGSLAAFAAGLPAHTQKLVAFLSFGNWIVVLSSAGVALGAILGAALHDPIDKEEDRSRAVFPIAFLAILVAAILINYVFINYTLIPKGTEIVQRLAS